MAKCEICGSEAEELSKTKISGAELRVCSSCTSLGKKVDTEDEDSDDDSKYSTSSTGGSSSGSGQSRSSTSTQSQNSSGSNKDPFDEVSNLAIDYGDRIQSKRSSEEIDRSEFAQELGIKESHLRNIENQDTQPSIDLQQKIEKSLGVDLSQSDDLGR